ncbi:MAG: hypothetical protein LBI82_04730 [Dysgonamonadaceae bacterium]|jgi:hypothetical protein|nr:hypothetical protein [Dysgonamonadaceae bacterium]
MNTKEKKRKNIFEVLFEKNICFAVCASLSRFIGKGIEECSTDYTIIINQCDVESIEDFTFYQTDNYKQVFERKLSSDDYEFFKEHIDRFIKVKHNKHGRVYELKGNSFKASFDNNRRRIQNVVIKHNIN